MARQNSLVPVLIRVDRAVRELAAVNGWGPANYRLYVRFVEGALVDSLDLLLEAKSFPGIDEFEQWDIVRSFLDRKLNDLSELRGVLHLVTRTFEQAEDEGDRTIRDSYTPIEELISATPSI